jgi:hypothetical protein
MIFAYMELVKEHLLKKEPVISRESRAPSNLTPPPPGEFLLNVDAAIFEAADKMGTGVVARDSSGEDVVSCRYQMNGVVA